MQYNDIENRYLNRMANADFPGVEPAPEPAGTVRPGAMQGEMRAIPQTQTEKILEGLGITLEKAGQLVDEYAPGSLNSLTGKQIPIIGEMRLRDLIPFIGGTEQVEGPTGEMMTKEVGTPQALQMAGRGESLTTGTGFTTQMKPDVKAAALDVGMTVAPFAKQAGQAVTKVVKATEGLPVGMSTKAVGGTIDQIIEVPVKIAGREIKVPADQAAILSKAVKNLTPDEQAKFKSNTAKTFVENLTALPSKQEFGAAAVAGSAKKGWYEGSTQAIVNVFGPDADRFAALLSATSPQTSVESNLYNALQIWKNWTAAGRPTDRESIVRVMGQSVQGGKGEESVLDAWINNSVRALSAEDPKSVMLSGPKVDSFMRNLQGNVNEVTNDAWMASFALVDQKIFGGSLTKTDPGKGPGYLAMNARVRETADYLTKLTGEKWTPAEVQETIWSWAKTLYETAGAAGETRSAVQLVRDNAVTDQLIASTPDFRTLFYDDRFAPILEQAGYGEQLAKLRAAAGASDVATGGQAPRAGGQAGPLDTEAQRKLLERNAKRLDKLRKQREQAAAEKAASQKGAE